MSFNKWVLNLNSNICQEQFIKNNGFAFLCILVTICFQFCDVKIFNIKLYELLLLLMASLTISKVRVVHSFLFLFSLFFLTLVVKTLVLNLRMKFFINTDLPFLKMPYWLTVVRGVEYFCCIYFVYIIIDYFKNRKQILYESVYFLIKIQVYLFFPIYLIVFCLYYFEILKFFNFKGFLVYDTSGSYGDVSARLRGFFVEGGPLGLFYSYIYFINGWVEGVLNKKNYLIHILIILIVVMAASKAGYVVIIFFHLLQFSLKIKSIKIKSSLKLAFILLSVGLTSVFIFFILKIYIGQIGNELVFDVLGADLDRNWMMGRIAAITIVPNMLSEYFWSGIGLGNYSLIRNNPLFLGGFPEIPVNEWDLPGLGGIIDMLVDGGFILFLFLIGIFIYIFLCIKSSYSLTLLFFSFTIPFVAGAQFYLIYPWFSLAVIIAAINNPAKNSDVHE